MLEPKQLDDLARRLAESMPEGVKVLREDLSRGLRSTLETGLGRLDLVTREEFDVQAAVLARTRAKLEGLAARVAELEAAAGGSKPTAAGVDTVQPSRKRTAAKKATAARKQQPKAE